MRAFLFRTSNTTASRCGPSGTMLNKLSPVKCKMLRNQSLSCSATASGRFSIRPRPLTEWLRQPSGNLRKPTALVESRALAGVERRYVELADHVLAVSENDRAFHIQYVDPSRVSVIPTGVDTEYFRPCPDPEQPDTMAFTGTMDWM